MKTFPYLERYSSGKVSIQDCFNVLWDTLKQLKSSMFCCQKRFSTEPRNIPNLFFIGNKYAHNNKRLSECCWHI